MVLVVLGEELKAMKRSKHFDSDKTSCPCCGFDNVRAELLVALEELRDLTGGPLYLLSGTRCPIHNKEIDGAPGSAHLWGKGADICSSTCTPKELAKLAESIELFRKNGIGVYESHVHVDIMERYARW